VSRTLRTSGLPPTHGPVGYRWQNTGSLCSLINTRATSCRTNGANLSRNPHKNRDLPDPSATDPRHCRRFRAPKPPGTALGSPPRLCSRRLKSLIFKRAFLKLAPFGSDPFVWCAAERIPDALIQG
jgi:hypothetical protein